MKLLDIFKRKPIQAQKPVTAPIARSPRPTPPRDIQTIGEVIDYLRSNLEGVGIMSLYPGATDERFDRFETTLGLKLPDDIKEFYQFSDGLDTYDHLFRIIPLEDILTSSDEFTPGTFYIAEYMIYSDVWEVEVVATDHSEYRISTTNHGGQKITLTNSFAEFLGRFLTGGLFDTGGLYEWYEEIAKSKTV